MPNHRALIIVDVQNDFCDGGALAVSGANAIIPEINELRETLKPDLVVLTQDWHPENHTSFITNNPGEEVFKPRKAADPDGSHQMMWPVHCVQGTRGAEFHPDLKLLSTDRVVQKGRMKDVDSYSGFGSAEFKTHGIWVRAEETNLENILEAANIKEVFVVGLAFDYCVAATAKDALALGYKTTIISNCTASVAPESADKASAELIKAGIIYLGDYTPDAVADHNIRVLGEAEKALSETTRRLIVEVTDYVEVFETEEQVMKKVEELIATFQNQMEAILLKVLPPNGKMSAEAGKRLVAAAHTFETTLDDLQRKLENAFPKPPSLWQRFKNWVLRR